MSSIHSSDSCPPEMKWEEGCENRVPRYLFKATSNVTPGYVSSAAIVPEAIINRLRGRKMLVYQGDTSQCSEWSNSLLQALALATRMAEHFYDPNVCICILDTTKVGKTGIYPESGFFGDSYSLETKYLAYGTIRNENGPCFKLVPFENLVKNGLFQFLPELEARKAEHPAWGKVTSLRRSFFDKPRAISVQELVKTREIATLFGENLILPVMVALLSLIRRQKQVWDSFREMLKWTDLVIPEGPLVSRKFLFHNTTTDDVEELPEVWQFTKVLEDICGHSYTLEYEEEFQKLLARELEEQSEKPEQSGLSEKSDDEEGAFENGVNSPSLAPAKVLPPESEGYCASQDEKNQSPAVYPDTPTSMVDDEWEMDVLANGENGDNYI